MAHTHESIIRPTDVACACAESAKHEKCKRRENPLHRFPPFIGGGARGDIRH
jgi:hypothetical protein